MDSLKKHNSCPKCLIESPSLILRLLNPDKYNSDNQIPDNRVYTLVCLNCGQSIDCYTINNTITALVKLRNKMNELYGESEIYPLWSFYE